MVTCVACLGTSIHYFCSFFSFRILLDLLLSLSVALACHRLDGITNWMTYQGQCSLSTSQESKTTCSQSFLLDLEGWKIPCWRQSCCRRASTSTSNTSNDLLLLLSDFLWDFPARAPIFQQKVLISLSLPTR